MSTKGVASLLSDTLWRTLTFPITYLLVFILIISALAQIRYVNRALQRFDSTQVIPVQFVLFTISVIIGSAVLYRDFQYADAAQFGKFFGGCALTFMGVYLITSRRGGDDQDRDPADMEDEEEAIGMVDEERYQDEVEETDEDRSRRKSSVSFAFDNSLTPQQSRRSSKPDHNGPLIPPQTPPLHSSSSASSPRYTDIESPLLENPWESSPSRRPRPPLNAVSTPQLPTEAHPSRLPATPLSRQQTPTRLSSSRPSALSRRSIAQLTPGPLLPPLSSSLSAVVADNLRRGLDSPPGARRRPGLSAALGKSKSQRATARNSTASEGRSALPSPLKDSSAVPEVAVEEEDDGGRPNISKRSKSVSAALEGFFHLKRARSKGKGTDQEGGGHQR